MCLGDIWTHIQTDGRTDRVIPKYLLLHVTWFAGDIVMTLLLSLLVLVCVM